MIFERKLHKHLQGVCLLYGGIILLTLCNMKEGRVIELCPRLRSVCLLYGGNILLTLYNMKEARVIKLCPRLRNGSRRLTLNLRCR